MVPRFNSSWSAVSGLRSVVCRLCPQSGDGNSFEDCLQNVVGGYLGGFRLNAANDPVPQSWNSNFLDIARHYVVPFTEENGEAPSPHFILPMTTTNCVFPMGRALLIQGFSLKGIHQGPGSNGSLNRKAPMIISAVGMSDWELSVA